MIGTFSGGRRESTHLLVDLLSDFLVFGDGDDILRIATMQVREHAHALGIIIRIDQPSATDQMEVRGAKPRSTHLGLSGIMSEPKARIVPMTHCNRRGTRQDKSESIKEQK